MSKRLVIPEKFTDEHFLARLGVISVQNRIDPRNASNTRWTSRFTIGGHRYHIEGFAADFGRPRGVDTNVQIAMETLFERQGCPENNTIVTTAHELLTLSLMKNKGDNYERLRESLMRLWRVGFLVSQAHHQPGSPWALYLNETLNLVQRIRFWSKGARRESPDLSTLVADGKLLIQLSDPVAQSIRAGFTHPLDTQLLSRIEQPVGRGVYRLLEAYRPAGEGGVLRVPLADWANACGIFSPESDKIRRTLEAAHEELEANGYLDGIEFEGRGMRQVLHYRFRPRDAADPALVRVLREHGVSAVRAELLAKQHPDRVMSAVRYTQQQKRVVSPGAFIADILAHPDKYVLPEEGPAVNRAVKPDPRVVEAQVEREQQERQRALLSLSPEEQWAAAQQVLRFLLRKRLDAAQFEALEQACRSGQLSATALAQDLSAATAQARRDGLIQELLGQLPA